MKICVVTSWFPTSSRPNLGSFVYQFAKLLATNEFEVLVIAPWQVKEQETSYEENFTVKRIKGKFPVMSMFKLIRKFKPDIIHIQAPNFFSSLSIPAAKILKIPIVGTVHRAEVDVVNRPLAIFRKKVLGTFNHVIAVSKFAQELAIRAGANPDKLSIIYNSCAENIFHKADKVQARVLLCLRPEMKVLLFVGNLVEEKGIDILINSLKKITLSFPRTMLLIVGDGPERKHLEDLVSTLGLSNHARFLGFLPNNQLVNYYNAADIFVLPSRIEGHSVALLEAMSCGLPVIACAVGGNVETIEPGINGLFFKDESPDDLADKIELLFSDYNLLNRFSDAAVESYHKNFGATEQMKKYSDLYTKFARYQDETHLLNILLFDAPGLSHYSSYLAYGLSKYNHINLHVFSEAEFRDIGADSIKRIDFHRIKRNYFRKHPIFALLIRPLYMGAYLLKTLLKSNYDVVHVQGHLPMFFLFVPMLKVLRKKYFWTVHDITLRPSSSGWRGKIELIYVILLARPNFLAKHSQKIFVHGSYLKKQLIDTNVPSEKIVIVPHFDYLYLMKKLSPITQKSNLPEDYVLFFGRLKPYKGIDILIEAAKIAKKSVVSLNLLIAGEGDLKSQIRSIIQQEDWIFLKNEFIKSSEIPAIFSNSRFAVMPYTDASQSGITSLAYTFSKPVIVSDVGSLPEYVEDGKTGFVFKAGDSVQLARLIVRMYRDANLSSLMGKMANEKLLKEMSLEVCCRIINDSYTTVVVTTSMNPSIDRK